MKDFKLISFIIISAIITCFYVLSCFPVVNKTVFAYRTGNSINSKLNKTSTDTTENTITINSSPDENLEIINLIFDAPFEPEISDYILISMRVENIEGVANPTASIAVNLGEEVIDITDNSENKKTAFTIQERTKIYIDGLNHTYYIPIGENKFYGYNWSLDEITLREQIKNLTLEIPVINGIAIKINSIAVKKRIFFALDSHTNYFFKNYFRIANINRYLTPSYIFLIFFFLLFSFYRWTFMTKSKKFHNNSSISSKGSNKSNNNNNKSSSGCSSDTNNNGYINSISGGSNNKTRILSLYFIPVLSAVLILVLFSSYFLVTNLFTAKSYWDSYKKFIISGKLDETYHGFYNFEKFLTWVDKKIPKGENLIVLLQGEPVYIMSEMAYNLYPRDIKFINISQKTTDQIMEEINEINDTGKYKYVYIIILSKNEIMDNKKLIPQESYKETGGFIFKFVK